MSGEVRTPQTHQVTLDTNFSKSTVYNKYHNKLQLYLLIIFCPICTFQIMGMFHNCTYTFMLH